MSETKEVQFCKHNPGVVCDPKKANCEKCGWNPEVELARKARLIPQTYGRTEGTNTERKVVQGTVVTLQGGRPAVIALSVTKKETGNIFTMEHTAAGMALAIPAQHVKELIGVVQSE